MLYTCFETGSLILGMSGIPYKATKGEVCRTHLGVTRSLNVIPTGLKVNVSRKFFYEMIS